MPESAGDSREQAFRHSRIRPTPQRQAQTDAIAIVRPPLDEPVRRPDPLDLISHDSTRVSGTSPVVLATKAIHTLTRVTREKAAALIGDSLSNVLRRRGEPGNRAWQAIAELPEDDRRAALGSIVDELE